MCSSDLGLMYFIGQGGFRQALAPSRANEIELLALRRKGAPRTEEAAGESGAAASEPGRAVTVDKMAEPGAGTAVGRASGAAAIGRASGAAAIGRASGADVETAAAKEEPEKRPHSPGEFRDRFSKQMAMVRDHYGLSARETEVAELIARGNSVARIAEILVVSENTIRTHSKRIYTKLDIHKRQELIELVESFDPEGR